MPEVDGFKLMSTFRRLWPATPILAYTGSAPGLSDRMLSLALSHGADQVCTKPFTLESFVQAAQSLVAEVSM